MFFRGSVSGTLFGVFGTWPANFVELLGSWARGGNAGHISLVKHVAYAYALHGALSTMGADTWGWYFTKHRVGKDFEGAGGVPVVPFAPAYSLLDPTIALQTLQGMANATKGLLAGDVSRFKGGKAQFLRGLYSHIPIGSQAQRIRKAGEYVEQGLFTEDEALLYILGLRPSPNLKHPSFEDFFPDDDE